MFPLEDLSVGQRLQRERKRLNWSQERLAEALCISNKSISRWELDKALPHPHYREQLCHIFNVRAEALFGVLEARGGDVAEPSQTWNVPHLRNRYFSGREDLLLQIHETLTAQNTVALTALSGLGGVGKTQSALEYAYRYADEYKAVLWASADTAQSLVSDYLLLAELLNLPEKHEADQQRAVKAVVRWLQQTPQGWLLILDNVEDLDLLSDFLPKGGTGHVLLTTRMQATGSTIERIEVETLGQEEGTLLLLRRAKLLKAGSTLERASQKERCEAEAINAELGGLPLALDQAGAYIEENQCSIADYLRLYRTRRAELLRRRGGVNRKEATRVVATTWNLSFEQVEQANAAAADLLRLCTFLHPDGIAEALLLAGSAELGPTLQAVTEDPLMWDEAIGVLRRSSLVQRTAETKLLTLHRLVQATLKDAMDAQIYRIWAERAVRVVNRAFPEVEFSCWPTCQAYLPHALLCAELIEHEGMSFPEAARLLHQAAHYLHQRARYSEAEPLYQRALAIREQVLGPTHPDTAHTLHKLGWLYCTQGKYEQAEPLYQRALAIWEQALGPSHPNTAHTLSHLGSLYHTQGKYEWAEALYQRALSIREQVLGPTYPDTAQSLDNLALMYVDQSKYEQAEPLYQRALAIWEQALGPSHPDTAQSLNNLATLYFVQGKYELAEPLYIRALSIWEQALGPTHPDLAQSLNNLAGLYHEQGKYELAEALIERALSIFEQGLGPTHHVTATAIGNLAELYRLQGKYELAEPLTQRALSLLEQQLGPEHAVTVQNLHNLAELYRLQGKYELAEPLAQRALSIRERQWGPEHVETAASLNDVALLYQDQGKDDLVEPLLQRALSIREQVLGASHPDTARSLHALAVLYSDQGKYEQAEALFLQALGILGQALGPEHPAVADILENYAALVHRTKAKTKVTEVERRAKAMRARADKESGQH